MTEPGTPRRMGAVLAPLALAQFVCSFAGSNMNVMINDISNDLDTTPRGVQITITTFLLVMAALMIPAGRMTDRFGRKRCFVAGLTVYGAGAALSAVAPGLGVLVIGNSILQGIGTSLLIPPVYILATMLFPGLTTRARAFGTIMAMGGIGAAAGPLIGGLITSLLSWRAAFAFQVLVIVIIVLLSRSIRDPLPPDPTRRLDTGGAVLSATGLVLLVSGILFAGKNISLMLGLLVLGSAALVWFFLSVRNKEKSGREPLIPTSLFRNRTSNLGLVTQNTQWILLMGTAFVVATYFQVARGYDAVQTGAIFTAATTGLLVSSLAAERLARRRTQRTLITTGFATTITGIAVLIGMTRAFTSPWASAAGLLLIGLGLGVMLTPSVNIVQSSFPEHLQSAISGVSRSVSNLGSALGTAIAGTVLLADPEGHGYAIAMIMLAFMGTIGLLAAVFLPHGRKPSN
ncbi:MAG: MFS transporter [Umezawaea sp.]